MQNTQNDTIVSISTQSASLRLFGKQNVLKSWMHLADGHHHHWTSWKISLGVFYQVDMVETDRFTRNTLVILAAMAGRLLVPYIDTADTWQFGREGNTTNKHCYHKTKRTTVQSTDWLTNWMKWNWQAPKISGSIRIRQKCVSCRCCSAWPMASSMNESPPCVHMSYSLLDKPKLPCASTPFGFCEQTKLTKVKITSWRR